LSGGPPTTTLGSLLQVEQTFRGAEHTDQGYPADRESIFSGEEQTKQTIRVLENCSQLCNLSQSVRKGLRQNSTSSRSRICPL
ncbi:hypothetical protein RvY_02578, partial [Ramazzottius varieornatus]